MGWHELDPRYTLLEGDMSSENFEQVLFIGASSKTLHYERKRVHLTFDEM